MTLTDGGGPNPSRPAVRRGRGLGRPARDPDADLLVVDVDGTLLDAHSPKPGAAGTDKHGYGCSPLVAFLDHGDGTGETVSGILRPGNAGSNTAPTALLHLLRARPEWAD